MSGRGPADSSLRITAVDEGMKTKRNVAKTDLATIARFGPVRSNVNDMNEDWESGILHAELSKIVTYSLFCSWRMGAVVVEHLTITVNNMARFSFGILFWWIVQYVQGRNRHTGFSGLCVVLAVNHL